MRNAWTEIAIHLLYSQNPGSLSFCGSLLLVAPVEGYGALVAATKVIQVLDLVNSDDPVLAGEGLLNGAQLGPLGGHA